MKQLNSTIAETPPAPADLADPFPRHQIEQSILDRFLDMVEKHAEQLAIATDDFVWTYRQLANIVDQLAEKIVSKYGAGPGRIALLFTHDAPMCAAMLATLRAGKTYVPLDPDYPAARLSLIYEDSEPEALFTEGQCLQQAQAITQNPFPLLVCDSKGLNPDVEVCCTWPPIEPTGMAYILYTSGSTGRPKGVIQSHRNVLHFICEYTANLFITSRDRFTLLSSYGFDASVMATYGALLNGALLLPRNIKATGFAALGVWLNEWSITIYHSTPTVFRAFLANQGADATFPSVRLVVLGGEPVTRSDFESFNRHFVPGSTLVNGLGPTESTVTLQNFIAHGSKQQGNLVSVGRPVRNTDVLLLNDEGQPTDTEGELAFCSEHLAVGYWRRPDQDARAFVAHPEHSHRRIYRTGDLARLDASGMFYFLGRKDLQVKINGVRIELEDIECVVEKLEGVRQCIVVADRREQGQATLIAFVRMRQADAAVTRLGEQVRTLLPDAMVPHRFLAVSDFPLTPSNKVDRKVLEQQARLSSVVCADRVEFHGADALEERLIALWQDVLGSPPEGYSADFFESGGDSMSALQLVDCIEELTGTRIDFGEIFVNKTFGEMVELARSSSGVSRGDGIVVPLTRPTVGGSQLFSICGIQLYKDLADALSPSVAVCGIFLSVEEEILRGRAVPPLEVIARMYLTVLLKKQPVGPFNLIGVSFGGMLAYEMARQLHADGHRVAYLGILDTTLPQTIGFTRRMRAHFELVRRRGVGWALSRVRARILNMRGEREPNALETQSAEERALARGDIYIGVLSAYRKTMPTFEGDAWFYRATQLSEFEQFCFPADCNWSRYVRGKFRAHQVPGGHISMLRLPYANELARLIRADMGCQARPRGDLHNAQREESTT